VQPRPEQRLVDVNVTQTPQKLLIQQQALQPTLSTVKECGKISEAHLQWVWTLHRISCRPSDPAKAAYVVIEQDALIEHKLGASVRCAGSVIE